MKELRGYQLDAIERMHNGCILKGDVGSGKSFTALAYFFKQCAGDIYRLDKACLKPMDLLIITTARKRDTKEWEEELEQFNLKGINVSIDSWNNIQKYNPRESFIIFDEQRVVGWGAWSKKFIELARNNNWILLSATPGDTWSDYIPVFIANGFYHNKTEFTSKHIVYSRYSKFPKVERYIGVRKLVEFRDSILVDMDFTRPTEAHHEDIIVSYDIGTYKNIMRTRWNPYHNEPIINASVLCYCLRRLINSSPERLYLTEELARKRKKVIIFYNFDYELELLRKLDFGPQFVVAEWNGHKHEQIPEGDHWVYLVQYTAGAEGWNCIKTDTIIFYSQNYSYKIMKQSAGRIDRMNTPFKDLYYYHIRSRAPIDLAIRRALNSKREFNERRYYSKLKGE